MVSIQGSPKGHNSFNWKDIYQICLWVLRRLNPLFLVRLVLLIHEEVHILWRSVKWITKIWCRKALFPKITKLMKILRKFWVRNICVGCAQLCFAGVWHILGYFVRRMPCSPICVYYYYLPKGEYGQKNYFANSGKYTEAFAFNDFLEQFHLSLWIFIQE